MKKLYFNSFKISMVLLLMTVATALYAQDRVVSGKVSDETGNGMPGVNVLVKGTSNGTATDGDGNYRISVSNDAAILVFSFVGYASQEATVGTRSTVDVQLAPDVTTLTELVVTGYAVQEKKDVTGSVSVVKPAELNAMPQGNVSNQLQGRVAGLTVVGR